MSGNKTEVRCKIYSGENLPELLCQVAKWITDHSDVALIWDVLVDAVRDDNDGYYIRVYFQCNVGVEIE